ncbi:MAG: response regulator [Deltaproteobacteria bacterium]|nr:response regulator [Deltaproteobacteria bacterium]
MAKQNLLLVDADPRSLRVLEVSLRKAGYSVAACSDAAGALEMMELSQPDLILSDTRLPEMDGFSFVEEIRKHEDWANVPFMFLSSDVSVESKVKGLELGVEDYLTKPIYIKEIITRVNLVLQRKKREGMGMRDVSEKARFSGSLSDMGLVDLLQTVDIGKKSGVLYISSGNQRGAIYFRDGALVDAEIGGKLRGDRAVYRALVWSDGTFEIDFRPVRRQDVIKTSTQGVLMEGMRRMDEWGRMLEQLPPLDSVFEVNEKELLERLAEIPDEINDVLRYFDGKNSLMGVVELATGDDLDVLAAISKLYFEGIILDTGCKSSFIPPPGDEEATEQSGEADFRLSDKPAAALRAGVVPGQDDALISNGERDASAKSKQKGSVTKKAVDEHAAGERRRTLDFEPPHKRAEVPPKDERLQTPLSSNESPISRDSTTQSERDLAAANDNIIEFPLREKSLESEQNRPERQQEPPETRTRSQTAQPAPDDATAEHPAERADLAARIEDSERETLEEEIQDERSAYERDTLPPPKRRGRRRRKRLRFATSTGMLSAATISPETMAALQSRTLMGPQWTAPYSLTEVNAAPASTGEPTEKEEIALDEADLEPVRIRSLEPPAPEPVPVDTPLLPKRAEIEPKPAQREAIKPPVVVMPVTIPNDSTRPVAAEKPKIERAAERKTVRFEGQPIKPASVERSDEPTVPVSPAIRNLKRASIGIVILALIGLGAQQIYQRSTKRGSTPVEREKRALSPESETRQEGSSPFSGKGEVRNKTKIADTPPAKGVDTEAENNDPQAESSRVNRETESSESEASNNGVSEKAPEQSGSEQTLAAEEHISYDELIKSAKESERTRDRAGALKLYQQAIQINPNGHEALSKVAFYYLNQGKNREAAEYAARSLQLDPSRSEAWIVLGAARYALKDKAGAQAAYQKCVDVGKGPYVRECRRMLR